MSLEIFISHGNDDQEFITGLQEVLQKKGFAIRGSSPAKEEKNDIEGAGAFLVVISGNSFKTQGLMDEIKRALQVKAKNPGYRLIFMLREGVEQESLNLVFPKSLVRIAVPDEGLDFVMPTLLDALTGEIPDDSLDFEGTEAAKIDTDDWSGENFLQIREKITQLLKQGEFPVALREARSLLAKCMEAGEKAYPQAGCDIAGGLLLLGRIVKTSGMLPDALGLLAQALNRYESLASAGQNVDKDLMTASMEMGRGLGEVGQFQEAMQAYAQGIEIAEKLGKSSMVAIGKFQMGTALAEQQNHGEAISHYHQSLEIFERLDEKERMGTVWHHLGMACESTGDVKKAENCYRESLAVESERKDKAGEAVSLNQLGKLYRKSERFEESAECYRQAIERYVSLEDRLREGRIRTNIAVTLTQLGKYDDARNELKAALDCYHTYGHAAAPWQTWMILHNLENCAGNLQAAVKAREKAIELFAKHRREGGVNMTSGGKLSMMTAEAISRGQSEEVIKMMDSMLNDQQAPAPLKVLVPVLKKIAKGERDPKLADDPNLHYTDAVEIQLILETLEQQ